MFADSITYEAEKGNVDESEIGMVGSAGLSGHKTAWKQVSAFAPGENDPYRSGLSTGTAVAGRIAPPSYQAFDSLETWP